MKKTGLSQNQKLDPPPGPATHDDLTIADHLRAWQESTPHESREYYGDGTHPPVRVPEDKVEEFLKQHGALHPGNYREQYEHDWREDFLALGKSR